MEGKAKFCPSCSKKIIGRSDKIYCSIECRTFANNKKQKELQLNLKSFRDCKKINQILLELSASNKIFYIKLIYFLAKVCRIIYKFGSAKRV